MCPTYQSVPGCQGCVQTQGFEESLMILTYFEDKYVKYAVSYTSLLYIIILPNSYHCITTEKDPNNVFAPILFFIVL